MKLLFINGTPVRFNVETPGREPLGGTESATAYLARHLAANGHDVTLVAPLPDGTPERLMGVRHLPFDPFASAAGFYAAEDFEAVIALSAPGGAPHLKRVAPRAFHVCWIHMLPDQPNMQPLRQMTPLIDCAVFVSEYHRAQMRFTGAAQVIGNGIAPAFENLFGSAEELRAAKQNRAVYTSMPFRGLDVLVKAMGEARIETDLDVYSGMRTYQEAEDRFAPLYEALQATPRCHYHGPLGQAALAEKLKRAAFLAYPSTFAETYCIVALEAIAAGLKVIATDYGALKETTLGFADLVPLQNAPTRAALVPLFAAQMEKTVGEFLARPAEWAEERFAQSQTINRLCSWAARAREWEAFLQPAIAWRRGA